MYSWEDPRTMTEEERRASREEFYRPRTMKELFEEAQERELREEEGSYELDYAENMPCDNTGYCAGTSCPEYFKTCHKGGQ